MGQISKSLFQLLADRVGKQADLMSGTLVNAKAGLGYYVKIHSGLPTNGDFDVEDDLISPANGLDNFAIGTVYSNMFGTFLGAQISHVTATGASNLDQYLFNSGLNVDDKYNEVHKSVRGSDLRSINVFGPTTFMGRIELTNSGVGALTNARFVGDGRSSSTAALTSVSFHTDTPSTGFPTGKHAAARMKLVVSSGLGGGNGAATTLVLRLINEDNASQVRNVSFSSAETETVGNEKEIGSGGDFFLGFSGIANSGAFGLSGVVGGKAGLNFQVQSILERTIVL
jgi:hypothetical protein